MRRQRLTAILVLTLLASSVAAFGPWGMALAGWVLVSLSGVWARRTGRMDLARAMMLVAVIATIYAFSLVISAVEVVANRGICASHLHTIGVAMLGYERANGCLPPAYVCGKDGKPMHSWRVLLLPYLDCAGVYKKYNFDEPWNGPNNRLLASQMPEVYECPSALEHDANRPPLASYVVVTGPDTAFPGCPPRRLQDLAAPDKTVLLVEVGNSDIHWMEPRDPGIDDALAPGDGGCRPLTSHHGRSFDYWHEDAPPIGSQVVCADGSVYPLRGRVTPDDAKAILSIHADGKPMSVEAAERVYGRPDHGIGLRWDHVVGLPVFCLSLVTLVALAVTARRRDPRSDEPWALN